GGERIAPGREAGRQANRSLVVQDGDLPEGHDRDENLGTRRLGCEERPARGGAETASLSPGEPEDRVRVGEVPFHFAARRTRRRIVAGVRGGAAGPAGTRAAA